MRFLAELPRRLFLTLMLLGAGAITSASLQYFDPDVVAPFVIERLPVVRFASLWLMALKLHVASALLSFPLCLMLATKWLQRRPRWHRWLGRTAGVLVLFAMVPSGAILAFDATGGTSVSVGFWLSGAIVAGSMVYGVRAARRRDLVSHAYAMRHVLAQMSVAVTSRALLIGLDVAGIDPEVAYVAALWVPVVFSAAVVELVSRRRTWFFVNPLPGLQRIIHEINPYPIPVRVRPVASPVTRRRR